MGKRQEPWCQWPTCWDLHELSQLRTLNDGTHLTPYFDRRICSRTAHRTLAHLSFALLVPESEAWVNKSWITWLWNSITAITFSRFRVLVLAFRRFCIRSTSYIGFPFAAAIPWWPHPRFDSIHCRQGHLWIYRYQILLNIRNSQSGFRWCQTENVETGEVNLENERKEFLFLEVAFIYSFSKERLWSLHHCIVDNM